MLSRNNRNGLRADQDFKDLQKHSYISASGGWTVETGTPNAHQDTSSNCKDREPGEKLADKYHDSITRYETK